MNYPQQQQGPDIRITHIELIETKSYKPMNIRPYEVSANYDDLNKIKSVVINAMGRGSTNRDMIETYMNKANPNILMPSAQIISQAPIINGWSEKRFFVTIVLEIKHRGSNTTTINYISGYSEFLGISYKGTIDDKMRIFINSISVLRKTVDYHTGSIVTVPLGVYSVAYDETAVSMNNIMSQLKVSRPDDIMSRISSLKGVRANTKFVSNIGSLDNVQITSKDETTPMGHLSKTISTLMDNAMINGVTGTDSDIYDTATGDLLSLTSSDIDFYKLLYQIQSREATDFTLEDLSLIDSQYPDIIVRTSTDTAKRINSNQFLTDDGAYTDDSSYETRMSLVIQDAVSHIMSMSILDDVVFTINNVAGEPMYTVDGLTSVIENINLPIQGEIFVTTFINKAWSIISNNNKSQVKLEIFCYGTDMTIKMALDGRPEVVYIYPTFADAKYTPIIMDDMRQDIMAENYGEITETALHAALEVSRDATRGMVNEYYT